LRTFNAETASFDVPSINGVAGKLGMSARGELGEPGGPAWFALSVEIV
jgi:hypothetical protein